ncbi:hypothetical protein K2Y11_19515 [bacterium]|jgi:hypothetical protein|nr:hypothetical protein [bacterium]
MAILYTVSISVTRNHDGSDYHVDWLTVQLVDGDAEFDRWSLLKDTARASVWPQVGEWSRSPVAGTVDLFSNDFHDHLARLESEKWPWRRLDQGNIEFPRREGGSSRGFYRVLSVE